jgi:hypothetical protein
VRIHLTPELFQPPVVQVSIARLFYYAVEDRHRIDIDLADPAVAAWLAEQSRGLREEVTFAVKFSVEVEALEPSLTRVDVGRFATTDFATDPIKLRIEDAHPFLEEPLSLLLEDAITDRAFLLKMFTQQERDAFQKRLARGFVRIDHGGGLDSMQKRVLEKRANASNRYKLWLLFDSDALQPGQPGTASERLRLMCSDIPHYRLSRRFMESYLPPEALGAWARQGPNPQERHRRFALLDAFVRMRPEQRHHFNMKAGFENDANRKDALSGTLYDDVPQKDKLVLRRGFGPKIKDLFDGPNVTEHALRTDSGWSELRPVVRDLLERLR